MVSDKEVPMASKRKVKQSVYLPEEMLEQLRHEAERLDRPLSWVLHRAWKVAEDKIQALPSAA